jgi:hypothetical protein
MELFFYFLSLELSELIVGCCVLHLNFYQESHILATHRNEDVEEIKEINVFIVGECILLRMYIISKYRQPSFATVLQHALLYTYITNCQILAQIQRIH